MDNKMYPQILTQALPPYYYLVLSTAVLVVVVPLLFLKLRAPRKDGSSSSSNPPPGPWHLPVIGAMHHLAGPALPHRAMRDLARRHGPLMLLRMGHLPVVVASSAEAAKEVMKTHDAAFATRPGTATLRALSRDGLGVVFAPHGDHWRYLRRLCVTELLGARRVRALRAAREAEAASLVASLLGKSEAAVAVNVSALLSAHVVDVAVRAVVGGRITERQAFLEKLEEVTRVAAALSLADLFPSWRLARLLSGGVRRAEACNVAMNRLMDSVIEEHRARRAAQAAAAGHDELEEEDDLLDVLLRIQRRDAGLLDMGTVRAVILDLFGAGSATSATTLQWAMAELMRNPAKLGRAQAEVRGVLAGQSRAHEDALPEMRYLQLVLKETLRLHPPAPLLLPRECQEPRRVMGFDVPRGAMVLVNAWAIARDAAAWGADAEEFRPERFEATGGASAMDFKGTDFEFVPFGAGRRVCPGITFAVTVMELALASLLYHFDWELPAGVAPDELDMTEALGITAKRKNDLWLHATLRVPPVPA